MSVRHLTFLYWSLIALTILFLSILNWQASQSLEGHQVDRALAEFSFYFSILQYATPIGGIVLLAISSILFYKGFSGVYIWMSLATFTAFMLLNYMVTLNAYFDFKDENDQLLWFGRSFAIFSGIIYILMGVLITITDYFTLKKLRKR